MNSAEVGSSTSGLSPRYQGRQDASRRHVDFTRRHALNRSVQDDRSFRHSSTSLNIGEPPQPPQPPPRSRLGRSYGRTPETEEEFHQRVERSQNLQNPSGAAEPTPGDLAIRSYRIKARQLRDAEFAFDRKLKFRKQEMSDLGMDSRAGTPDPDGPKASKFSEFERVQRLTRKLIEAETSWREAKADCQRLRADILDDGISSMFAKLSEDNTAVTEGVWTAEAKAALAPAILKWRNQLPSLVDTVLAGQAEWTRRPDVDD